MSKYRFVFIVIFPVILAFALFYAPIYPSDSSADGNAKENALSQNPNTGESRPEIMMAELARSGDYGGLPIGEIKLHNASSTDFIALLIPQNHRYPGASVSDPKNDSAETTQKQIYQILKFMLNRYPVDFIMAEGDMYGAVPESKITVLKEKISLRGQMENLFNALKRELSARPVDKKIEEQFYAAADDILALLDRQIMLSGAPYVLEAQGARFALYGAENKETYDQCAELVRNYTYQQDRLAQCRQTGSRVAKSGTTSSSDTNLKRLIELLNNQGGDNSLLSGLLGGLTGRDDFSGALNGLEQAASKTGRENILGLIGEIKKIYGQLNATDNGKVTSGDLPARSENPYADINDTDKLESMIEDSESDINELVVDKRNLETAENFVRALNERGEKTGILQFGAGHEEGLIRDLNERGVTVVVIKPDEVLRREKAEAQTADLSAAVKQLLENNQVR